MSLAALHPSNDITPLLIVPRLNRQHAVSSLASQATKLDGYSTPNNPLVQHTFTYSMMPPFLKTLTPLLSLITNLSRDHFSSAVPLPPTNSSHSINRHQPKPLAQSPISTQTLCPLTKAKRGTNNQSLSHLKMTMSPA